MKITKTLFIPALLLLLTTSCGEQTDQYDACHCAPVLKNINDSEASALGFYEPYQAEELVEFLTTVMMDSLHFQLDSTQTVRKANAATNEFQQKFRLNIDADYNIAQNPKLGYALGKDTARINEILAFQLEENWLSLDKVKFVWSKGNINFHDEPGGYYTLYGLKLDARDHPRFSSKYVAAARNYKDPQSGEQLVTIKMNEEGTQKWAQMTSDNVGNFIAMVSNNKVLSAPIINGPITGGETLISGGLTKSEAQEFTDLINCEAHKQKVGQEAFEKEIAKCSEKK